MGKSSDGIAEAKDLTDEQKQSILEKMDSFRLTETEKGDAPARLFRLIALASSPQIYQMNDFGISDPAPFKQAVTDVQHFLKPMIKAAKALQKIMPSEEGEPGFDQSAEIHPWLPNIDHFDGAIADIFQTDEENGREQGLRIALLVRQLISALGSNDIPKGKPGPKGALTDTDMIVRAVCVYRQEQGMDQGKFWWGESDTNAGSSETGRLGEYPMPITASARLIVAVADGLDLADTNAHLKTCLSKYGREMKAAEREPRVVDLLFR